MSLKKFTMDELSKIDGARIAVAFDQAVQRCLDDCRDRPNVETSRKIVLMIEMKPVGADGEMDSCDVQFQLHDTAPKRRSKAYNMMVTRAGLMFNEMSPDDARQRTLDEAKGSGPKEKVDAG